MRFSQFSVLCICFVLYLNSCSKDTTILLEEQPEQEEANLSARIAAKKLYEDYYLASKSTSSEASWSGNTNNCDAGEVPQTTKDKIFQRIAYYRKTVGLNNVISENTTKSKKAQAAALMMKSNGTLDHYPQESWSCYSSDGSEGAGNSLLTQYRNAEAIDSYIRDYGSSNGPVGHRRWLLWPRLQEIGIGNTDNTNAIWVIGNAGTSPTDAKEFIAWPPADYFPQQLAYERWSFSIANANFDDTTIEMRDQNNNAVSLQTEALNTQFGDRTIVWIPAINTNTLSEDMVYTVMIKNVFVNEETKNFEYKVTLFDIEAE